MKMFFDYQSELFDRRAVQSDDGFATYKITGKECFIVDLYIKPESRETGSGRKIADKIAEIAKSESCTILTCAVLLSQKNPKLSMQSVLSYGFKPVSANESYVFFKKELV